MRANTYSVLGTVERFSDAATQIERPGDCVIVERGGVRRNFVCQCPCGCGDILPINLDPRAGKAWRIYLRGRTWSLFPSVDRETGCQSHFILSRGKITWCDWWDWLDEEEVTEFLSIVGSYYKDKDFTHFFDAAEELNLLPWDVLSACRLLVRRGDLEEGIGTKKGNFRPQRQEKS